MSIGNVKKFLFSVLFGLIGVAAAIMLTVSMSINGFIAFMIIFVLTLLGLYLAKITDKKLRQEPFSVKDIGIIILSNLISIALGIMWFIANFHD